MHDMAKLRDWAARIKAMPEGFTAFKINVNLPAGFPAGRFAAPLSSEQIRRIGRGYTNTREAAGEEIDIAVHGHNELDTTSAIEVCKAVESMRPLFVEDPLPVDFSEGWQALRNSTRLTLLVGEKLELVKGFKPFLDRGIADILHPDLAFAGGFTGTRKIADLAQVSRRPVALHNVGSLVLTYASAHFGSAIHNFFRSESALGRPQRHVEQMSSAAPPQVRNGQLQVPDGPGLGFVPDEAYLRTKLVEGEEFWT
jgi:L-alanine-DL-glutamate epimerase-like enolase superfamily enzyme